MLMKLPAQITKQIQMDLLRGIHNRLFVRLQGNLKLLLPNAKGASNWVRYVRYLRQLFIHSRLHQRVLALIKS